MSVCIYIYIYMCVCVCVCVCVENFDTHLKQAIRNFELYNILRKIMTVTKLQ